MEFDTFYFQVFLCLNSQNRNTQPFLWYVLNAIHFKVKHFTMTQHNTHQQIRQVVACPKQNKTKMFEKIENVKTSKQNDISDIEKSCNETKPN